MRIFQTSRQRAIAYAAFKELERILKEDGDMAPGTSYDVSGETITITLPPGTTIYREAGMTGDGTIQKKAVQNLYGYAVWALFLQRLALFKQANDVRRILMLAWKEAMEGTKVEQELNRIDPEIAEFVERLKAMPGPKRTEQTPRKVERKTAALAHMNFNGTPIKVAA